MPTAVLLLREESSTTPLASLVEKSQEQKPPLPQYDLQLSTNQLDLTLLNQHTISSSARHNTEKISDEGFESDIDTISIISSDGSLVSTSETTPNTTIIPSKTKEIDSGTGSTSSDSDNDSTKNFAIKNLKKQKESYNLVDCLCYTDIRVPEILIFLIKQEAFVFKFDNLVQLKNFYLNFTALKAVTNQIAYNKTTPITKFNLLHRTDQNGITHIEITREDTKIWKSSPPPPRSKIISLNTPDISLKERKLVTQRYSSFENLVEEKEVEDRKKIWCEKKPWSSSENILRDIPKKPERRKKGRAPPPPPLVPHNVLKGEFVRVNVTTPLPERRTDFTLRPNHQPNILTLLSTPKPELLIWRKTSTMPRMIKNRFKKPAITPQPASIENRFFGLSPQLRSLPSKSTMEKQTASEWFQNIEEEKMAASPPLPPPPPPNLKSVIKKVDCKKKNKKVTFSAYATVQVV